MSGWRGALWARQTPAVKSRSFAGSRPALDTGRWWNLVDTPRSERGAHWEFESPPAHQALAGVANWYSDGAQTTVSAGSNPAASTMQE